MNPKKTIKITMKTKRAKKYQESEIETKIPEKTKKKRKINETE